MAMTEKEFREGYASRSGIKETDLEPLGLISTPCECGEEGCPGWAMWTRDGLARRRELEKQISGATAHALVRSFTG